MHLNFESLLQNSGFFKMFNFGNIILSEISFLHGHKLLQKYC